jgi:hypothetical protein
VNPIDAPIIAFLNQFATRSATFALPFRERPLRNPAVTRRPMRWLRERPALAQTAFCLLVFLIGTTFEPVYQLGLFVWKVAKHSVEAL